MKNFILCVALVGCALACKSDKNASVSDPASANMPKKECCETKAGCCQDKADCSGAKADCQKCPAMKDKPQG